MDGIRVTNANKKRTLAGLYPATRMVAVASLDLGYRVDIYSEINTFRVTSRNKTFLIPNAYLPLNNLASVKIADDKFKTSLLLGEAGIPVARSVIINNKQLGQLNEVVSELQYPLVVKPLRDTMKGEGVITNIRSAGDLRKYVKRGLAKHARLLIEEYKGGLEDYRVLVLDGEIIGVLHRVRPYVVGDGRHSIRTLIVQKNAERAKSKRIKLGAIAVDDELRHTLRSQKLRLSSVPKSGRVVQLKNVCNLGAGGEVHDVTPQFHKKNAQLAVKVVKTLGLRLAGIDFLCADIAEPIEKQGGIIIEVNEHPDIAMHHFPQKGEPRDVTTAIMRALFRS